MIEQDRNQVKQKAIQGQESQVKQISKEDKKKKEKRLFEFLKSLKIDKKKIRAERKDIDEQLSKLRN